MPNLYKNKVVFGNTTLIDITDTTAEASDVAVGKYFYLASGQKVEGSAVVGGMTVVETPDPHGGTIVTISGDPVRLQSKTNISPTESSQTITPDSNYTGLTSVQINAIPSTYVGTGVTRRSSSDISANGATVNVPAGYYESAGSKSVATTTHPDPTVSVNSSTGLITASHTQTAGYVSAGTTTKTSQLSVQTATTITPTKSQQTAVAAGKYTTGAVTVAAIPSQYITTTDATAEAGDIISGETAYVNGSKITGSLVVQHYYTGSGTPSSSLGVNGDIYLKTS